jgi:hypothetical protein
MRGRTHKTLAAGLRELAEEARARVLFAVLVVAVGLAIAIVVLAICGRPSK